MTDRPEPLTPGASAVVTTGRRVVAVSDELLARLGLAREVVVGEDLDAVLDAAGALGGDPGSIVAGFAACLDRGAITVLQGSLPTGPVDHHLTPVRDERSEIRFVVYELAPSLVRAVDDDGSARTPRSEGPDAVPDEAVEALPDGRPTVLIVEDHEDLRFVVVQTLNADVRCLEASDGAQGLDMALRHRPDVIVTDVIMPAMGGDNLALTLRDLPALARTPLLVLSARTDRELRLRLLGAGVDDYMTKPFDPEELRLRVLNLVGRAGGAR